MRSAVRVIQFLLFMNGGPIVARGYSSFADVMKTTADGRPLSELFAELNQVLQIANEENQKFLDLFTAPTTSAVTSVLQSFSTGGQSFGVASEYGIGESVRPEPTILDMGASFETYDARWGATWQFLMNATSDEISGIANAILADDSELVFKEVMRTIFRDTNRSVTDRKTGQSYNVFAFYNGDGSAPPVYSANTFDGSHTHYRTSGANAIVSGDLDEIISDLKSHGHTPANGSQIVIFVNPTEGAVVGGFTRAGGAQADFIPALGTAFYTPNGSQIMGSQPSATFAGFPVKGAYGDALIVEHDRIPVGYVVGLASGGALAPTNPILLRENERLQGLQLITGPNTDYPLIDSYWVRAFGTGVRFRSAGLVMQITNNANYAVPALYA